MIKKIKKVFIILGLTLFITGGWIPVNSIMSSPLSPQLVRAATDPCHPENNKDNKGNSLGAKLTPEQLDSCTKCTNANLNPDWKTIKEAQTNNKAIIKCVEDNIIVKDLNMIVNILTGLVGLAVVGTLIVGGIQYSLAGGKPDATVNAKKRIRDGFIALAAYLFVFGFLQWLVPGGVF